jgi:hypothetical protein
MAVTNKIFIPTFISSINYEPVRTLPHLYFYNGLKESEEYFIQHYPSGSTSSIVNSSQTSFPYLDYYDGLTPNSSSNSLLFFNELPAYGEAPTGSLYTEYWDTYVSLLYNPRTRLFNASAIIPLADYFEMELNDIVQWRGNYYHLRAINDYNLKDGTCKIELLGPIIRDAVSEEVPPTPPISNCIFNFSSSVEPVVTTTTTAAPTTTTTTAAPVENCTAYVVGTRTGASFFFTYRECGTGILRTISINQNNREWYFCGAVTSALPPWGYANEIGPCSEPIPTTTTTTAGPTTTTTAAPTTTTTTIGCTSCASYTIGGSLGVNGTWGYTNCLTGVSETVGITSQVIRTVASRTAPVKLSGTGTASVTNVFTFPAGYNCGPFDFCKTETWRMVTKDRQSPPGFILTQYYNPTNCQVQTIALSSDASTYDISVISGSLTLGGPTSVLASITLLSTGSSSCCL